MGLFSLAESILSCVLYSASASNTIRTRAGAWSVCLVDLLGMVWASLLSLWVCFIVWGLGFGLGFVWVTLYHCILGMATGKQGKEGREKFKNFFLKMAN